MRYATSGNISKIETRFLVEMFEEFSFSVHSLFAFFELLVVLLLNRRLGSYRMIEHKWYYKVSLEQNFGRHNLYRILRKNIVIRFRIHFVSFPFPHFSRSVWINLFCFVFICYFVKKL